MPGGGGQEKRRQNGAPWSDRTTAPHTEPRLSPQPVLRPPLTPEPNRVVLRRVAQGERESLCFPLVLQAPVIGQGAREGLPSLRPHEEAPYTTWPS